MVVTYIPAAGYTNYKTIVSDNATPASGTYAWYFTAPLPKSVLPLREIVEINEATGVRVSRKGYYLDEVWQLETMITNNTDYQNMLKAIGTWEKASTMLYLNVQNEWAENLAVYPSYATPATLVQIRGTLTNFQKEPHPNGVFIRVGFKQSTVSV